MLKYFAFAAMSCGLCVFFLIKREPVCLLFLFLAVNFTYRALARRPRPLAPTVPDSVEYGALGRYDVDNVGESTSLGLYLQLLGWTVFVDIREDEFVEARQRHALFLLQNREALEESLREFIQNNPEFKDRSVASIGLHSKDLDQGEVFWEPTGYTLLKNRVFVA